MANAPSQGSQLLPINLSAPGAAGMTSLTSMSGDIQEWLFEANNAVYSDEGLLAPRRLFRDLYTSNAGIPSGMVGNPVVTYAGNLYFVANNSKMFLVGYGSTTELTALGDNGDTPVAFPATTDYWKAVYHNGSYVFFAQGQEAKIFESTTWSGLPDAPEVGIVHSAFTRLWAAGGTGSAGQVLYWSIPLDASDWSGTGSGSLDLSTYMEGDEVITAISDFSGYLLVFTAVRTIVLQNPFNVTYDSAGTAGTEASMSVKETLDGTGCVGMNAWCYVGEELFFMDRNGIRKMSRVLSGGGANPVDVVCPQMTNTFIKYLRNSAGVQGNNVHVRLNYHPLFKMVTVETNSQGKDIYVIWINRPLEGGAYSVTRWFGWPADDVNEGNYEYLTSAYGLYSTGGFAGVGPGILAVILTRDQTNSLANYNVYCYGVDGTNGTTNSEDYPTPERFKFRLKSAWLSFGDAQSLQTKIPKDLKLIYRLPRSYPTLTGNNLPLASPLYIDWKLRFDYKNTPLVTSFITGIDEDLESDFIDGIGAVHEIYPISLSGDGSLVQWELVTTVLDPSQESFALQRAGFQSKLGRIHQGI